MNHRTILRRALSIGCLATLCNAAFAQADLAQKKNCLACHSIDKKLLGPAYKDVAAKYAGQKDAVDKLSAKVMKGGAGVWGQHPDAGESAGQRGGSSAAGAVDLDAAISNPAPNKGQVGSLYRRRNSVSENGES